MSKKSGGGLWKKQRKRECFSGLKNKNEDQWQGTTCGRPNEGRELVNKQKLDNCEPGESEGDMEYKGHRVSSLLVSLTS